MTVRNWMVVTAVIFFIAGLAFILFAPAMIRGMGINADIGADVTPAAQDIYAWNTFVFTRLFGAMMLTVGALLWLALGHVTNFGQRRMALGLFIGIGLAAAITFVQQLQVWLSAAGWVMTIILAALAAGYAYFVFFPGAILPTPEEVIELERKD